MKNRNVNTNKLLVILFLLAIIPSSNNTNNTLTLYKADHIKRNISEKNRNRNNEITNKHPNKHNNASLKYQPKQNINNSITEHKDKDNILNNTSNKVLFLNSLNYSEILKPQYFETVEFELNKFNISRYLNDSAIIDKVNFTIINNIIIRNSTLSTEEEEILDNNENNKASDYKPINKTSPYASISINNKDEDESYYINFRNDRDSNSNDEYYSLAKKEIEIQQNAIKRLLKIKEKNEDEIKQLKKLVNLNSYSEVYKLNNNYINDSKDIHHNDKNSYLSKVHRKKYSIDDIKEYNILTNQNTNGTNKNKEIDNSYILTNSTSKVKNSSNSSTKSKSFKEIKHLNKNMTNALFHKSFKDISNILDENLKNQISEHSSIITNDINRNEAKTKKFIIQEKEVDRIGNKTLSQILDLPNNLTFEGDLNKITLINHTFINDNYNEFDGHNSNYTTNTYFSGDFKISSNSSNEFIVVNKNESTHDILKSSKPTISYKPNKNTTHLLAKPQQPNNTVTNKPAYSNTNIPLINNHIDIFIPANLTCMNQNSKDYSHLLMNYEYCKQINSIYKTLQQKTDIKSTSVKIKDYDCNECEYYIIIKLKPNLTSIKSCRITSSQNIVYYRENIIQPSFLTISSLIIEKYENNHIRDFFLRDVLISYLYNSLNEVLNSLPNNVEFDLNVTFEGDEFINKSEGFIKNLKQGFLGLQDIDDRYYLLWNNIRLLSEKESEGNSRVSYVKNNNYNSVFSLSSYNSKYNRKVSYKTSNDVKGSKNESKKNIYFGYNSNIDSNIKSKNKYYDVDYVDELRSSAKIPNLPNNSESSDELFLIEKSSYKIKSNLETTLNALHKDPIYNQIKNSIIKNMNSKKALQTNSRKNHTKDEKSTANEKKSVNSRIYTNTSLIDLISNTTRMENTTNSGFLANKRNNIKDFNLNILSFNTTAASSKLKHILYYNTITNNKERVKYDNLDSHYNHNHSRSDNSNNHSGLYSNEGVFKNKTTSKHIDIILLLLFIPIITLTSISLISNNLYTMLVPCKLTNFEVLIHYSKIQNILYYDNNSFVKLLSKSSKIISKNNKDNYDDEDNDGNTDNNEVSNTELNNLESYSLPQNSYLILCLKYLLSNLPKESNYYYDYNNYMSNVKNKNDNNTNKITFTTDLSKDDILKFDDSIKNIITNKRQSNSIMKNSSFTENTTQYTKSCFENQIIDQICLIAMNLENSIIEIEKVIYHFDKQQFIWIITGFTKFFWYCLIIYLSFKCLFVFNLI